MRGSVEVLVGRQRIDRKLLQEQAAVFRYPGGQQEQELLEGHFADNQRGSEDGEQARYAGNKKPHSPTFEIHRISVCILESERGQRAREKTSNREGIRERFGHVPLAEN